jgi:hypothetical protein
MRPWALAKRRYGVDKEAADFYAFILRKKKKEKIWKKKK